MEGSLKEILDGTVAVVVVGWPFYTLDCSCDLVVLFSGSKYVRGENTKHTMRCVLQHFWFCCVINEVRSERPCQ